MQQVERQLSEGERLLGAYRLATQTSRDYSRLKPLSSGMPFHADRFLEANGITRAQYRELPEKRRLEIGDAVLAGLFNNQDAREADAENTTLWLEAMKAKVDMERIEAQLVGRTAVFHSVHPGMLPIAERKRKLHLGTPEYALVGDHVWQRGEFNGSDGTIAHSPRVIFGQKGLTHFEVAPIDPLTLEPLVTIEFED